MGPKLESHLKDRGGDIANAEFHYDVFISYSHADEEWVRGELLPRLEGAGLKVIIDYRDFEPGAPLLTEMERAVLESRKTVLMLTPAYLDSEWTGFENILVQTLDPGAHQRRVLPVILQPCELPLRIRALVYIDLSPPQLSEAQFQRLLTALARDTPTRSGTAGGEKPLLSAADRASLQRQLESYKESLRLIDERIAEFVEGTEVPLTLLKNRRRVQKQIEALTRQLGSGSVRREHHGV